MLTQAPTNTPEYTVSELSFALKRMVEGNFEHVRLRGEISGFKRAASGHLYMTLKDTDAVIDAVCWRGVSSRLTVNPADGLEVICTGKLTTYPGRSKYQIVIESMELAGEGAILKMLEERKKKLAAEGLFDEDRKKPLPFLPEIIGVITSPTGAVIEDIKTTLERRFPRSVLLAPTLVQGDNAADQVTAAILGFSNMKAGRPDVLIVARGGGSLEDLLPFSEENVVRAVAMCEIPVISSVGHETDTMLIDYAADRRAPTPTAAAEMAVPVRDEILARLQKDGSRLTAAILRFFEHLANVVQGMGRGLIRPDTQIMNMAQRLDAAMERLQSGLNHYMERAAARLPKIPAPTELVTAQHNRLTTAKERVHFSVQSLLVGKEAAFTTASQLLESYSYKGVLKRGFVLVRNEKNQPVTAAAKLKGGQHISLTFTDGEANATVDTPEKQGTLL